MVLWDKSFLSRGTNVNIGLTIPGNWSFEIRRISPEIHTKSGRFHLKSAGFHEIRMKSGGFHMKSARNPPDFMNVSFWVITKCRSFFRKTKNYPSEGPFTVSVSVSVYSDANKWVQLTSMVLFTLNDAKHQRKKTQTLMLTLTVNRP